MKRITISVPEQICKKIEQRARVKEISFASYARQLLEFAVRIDEIQEENEKEGKEPEDSIQRSLNLIVKLLERNTTVSQESVYLNRYLTLHKTSKSQTENEETMQTAFVKAKEVVQALLKE